MPCLLQLIRKSLCFLSFALLSHNILAQSDKKTIGLAEKDRLFSKNHIGGSFTFFRAQAAQINKANTDRYQMKAKAENGFELGLQYAAHLNSNWSVVTGFQFGLAGRNTSFTVPKEDFDPQPEKDYRNDGILSTDYDAAYLSLPVGVEKRWFTRSKGYWTTALGVNIRYSLVSSSRLGILLPEHINREPFYTISFPEPSQRIYLNYNAAAGHTWMLANKKLLALRVVANYSPFYFLKGDYRFDLPNKPVESGTYKLSGSYVGLSGSYTFTRARK